MSFAVGVFAVVCGVVILFIILYKNLVRLRREADAARVCLAQASGIDGSATAHRIWVNAITRYNNAAVTFPAVLFAAKVGFARQDVPDFHTGCAGEVQADCGDEPHTLAEASRHIMNPYMLWAVGMSDMSLDEVPPR